jgi:iron complex outermembrane receptor protein
VIIRHLGFISYGFDPKKFVNGSTVYLEPSLTQLNEVTVSGFESNRRLLETSASVGLITARDLQRFSNTSLVPAVNTLPGVRMEERSPGSYRLSIRGSQIRSPFGVRNVKVYWNDIPFTDPGGNTPLNLIDFNHIGRLEVIKGPAGSIYGAGTGGALLLYSPVSPVGESSMHVNGLAGSYGLAGINGAYQSGSEKSNLYLSYAHQEAAGYREHSAMRRDAVHLRAQYFVDEKRTISLNGLYSDLQYQTPGGITLQQYNENPRTARLPTRVAPGSVQQQAGIYHQHFSLGVSQNYRFSDRLENTTSLYGVSNEFSNPFITNYETRNDQGFGGRTRFSWETELAGRPLRLVGGGEYQRSFTATINYGNQGGRRDTLQTNDEITTGQSILFGQAELELPYGFTATAGLSYNQLRYRFIRLSDVPSDLQSRRFQPVLSPRFALLKKLSEDLAARGSISFGFSPPSLGELRPSAGFFSTDLNPERGINYEVGLRGDALNDRFTFDIAVFSLQLSQTIVRRTLGNGAEYFTNAGSTSQNGLEVSASHELIQPVSSDENSVFMQNLRLWGSFTYSDFRFRNYRQGEEDYSGNRVTGVAPVVGVIGIDAGTRPGFYANVTFTFNDFTPLNDANTLYANDFALLAGRLGYQHTFGKLGVELFAGVDNALNEKYSLGNDLNAFGGRFFNAAARRNYFGGVRLKLGW